MLNYQRVDRTVLCPFHYRLRTAKDFVGVAAESGAACSCRVFLLAVFEPFLHVRGGSPRSAWWCFPCSSSGTCCSFLRGAGHAWFILDARQCNFASSFMAKQNNACSPCFPHMLMSKSTLLMVKRGNLHQPACSTFQWLNLNFSMVKPTIPSV